MAILSEYEEDQQKATNPSPSSTKPFNAVLDPTNPLGFLETVFDFVSRESDLFKSDYGVRDVNALVRRVKEKVDKEERKAKEKEREKEKEKVEKQQRVKEEAQASTSVKGEGKEEKVECEKTEDGKRG